MPEFDTRRLDETGRVSKASHPESMNLIEFFYFIGTHSEPTPKWWVDCMGIDVSILWKVSFFSWGSGIPPYAR